jgi:hypothetical protein
MIACALAPIAAMLGCDARPVTTVTIHNQYPASAKNPLVVYRARWQAVAFADPIVPGSSSVAEGAVPASSDTAYVVLAPGWDPASDSPPASLVVVQSREGFELHLDSALHIPIDDTSFIGNCAAGTFLSEAQAAFVTQLLFPDVFASRRYDPASCTVTAAADEGDAGAD